MELYLHDLLWQDSNTFSNTLNEFLDICHGLEIKPMLVLFDDCHRPFPKLGKQPKPVRGVHNSGWKQSPGMSLVHEIHNNTDHQEIPRLKKFVEEILFHFSDDERILMWDIYNEPGQFGIGEESFDFLKLVWDWAHEVRPEQPLTSCMHGSIGENIIDLNKEKSDIITFHVYESKELQRIINELIKLKRPIICTEYMAREFGTTFDFCLPIFKKNNIGCFNWGFVAGKSQTHFGWDTILKLKEKVKNKDFILEEDDIPEPKIWFHDIFRKDGSAFDESEVAFIKNFLK